MHFIISFELTTTTCLSPWFRSFSLCWRPLGISHVECVSIYGRNCATADYYVLLCAGLCFTFYVIITNSDPSVSIQVFVEYMQETIVLIVWWFLIVGSLCGSCSNTWHTFYVQDSSVGNNTKEVANRVDNSPYPTSKLPTDVWVLCIGVNFFLWCVMLAHWPYCSTWTPMREYWLTHSVVLLLVRQ